MVDRARADATVLEFVQEMKSSTEQPLGPSRRCNCSGVLESHIKSSLQRSRQLGQAKLCREKKKWAASMKGFQFTKRTILKKSVRFIENKKFTVKCPLFYIIFTKIIFSQFVINSYFIFPYSYYSL
jgi:hypothetical protein